MDTKVVLVVLVFCAVYVNSDDLYGRSNRIPEYVRIKRAKYYSNPPMRFYRRPPAPYPVKGAFSYTPPPNYMGSEDPYPGNFRPKVSASKRPSNDDGLGAEDISNIVNHLSKKDLNKIIEFAGEKYRDSPYESNNALNAFSIKESSDMSAYKSAARELEADQKFSLNGPYLSSASSKIEQIAHDMEYSDNSKPPGHTRNAHQSQIEIESDDFTFKGPYLNPSYNPNDNRHYLQNAPAQFYQNPTPFVASHKDLTDVPLHTEESMQNNQFSFVNSYIQQELYNAAPEKNSINKYPATKEGQLPKPVSQWEEQDFEVSHTNKVPVVADNSYEVKNFGDLPLMDYSSKLDTVSSYHVPHYSVISPSNHRPSPQSYSAPQSSYSSTSQLVSSASASAISAPKLEPAPPASAAREQSDAHLKATKIWTHKSRGAAYTLYDDGSLSLEKPGRPKPVYGQ